MRFCIAFFLIFFGISSAAAQIENTKPTLRIEAEQKEDNFKAPDGMKLPPRKIPGLTIEREPQIPNNSDFGKPEEKKLDIGQSDGLMDYTVDPTPKAFKKDAEADKAFGRDQSLGSVTTNGKEATVMYRDHQYVDGDRIRIFVNGDIVRANEFLDSSFSGVTVALSDGINRIEFQALNQGSSGPNTAELHVYDDKGQLISAEEWNLLTGYKATIIVVKN